MILCVHHLIHHLLLTIVVHLLESLKLLLICSRWHIAVLLVRVAVEGAEILTHLHCSCSLLRLCHVASIDAEVGHVVHGIELGRVRVTQKTAEIVWQLI